MTPNNFIGEFGNIVLFYIDTESDLMQPSLICGANSDH